MTAPSIFPDLEPLLPRVSKPVQYVGGELNAQVKDWESAAVAEGLIDLACLTDGWESKIADVCMATYIRTRWPEGAPAEFARVLNAARLYMAVRWLGDDPDFTRRAGARGHWMRLRELVTELQQT